MVDAARIALAEKITFNGMVRIIAGEHRGRRILGPRGAQTTRPMTDRVKESLFNRLHARDVLRGNVLDVFAGTGTLGLESLSRGAEHCTFVDRDRSAIELLRRNLRDLDLEARSTVCQVDALAAAWPALLRGHPIRLVLCDPPYRMTEEAPEQRRIVTMIESLASTIESEGLLMLRTQRQTAVGPVRGWTGPDRFPYGSMLLSFFHGLASDCPDPPETIF